MQKISETKKYLIISLHSPFTIISLCFSVSIIGITALSWSLVDYLNPFCMGALLLLSWVSLIIMIVASIIYLLFRIKKNITRAITPFIINVTTLLIICFVPFTEIWLELEFRLKWNDYNDVVKLVEEGQIEADKWGIALLPLEYRHTSRGGGEIIIDKRDGVTRIFFFTYRGILDNFSGYMYRSDDNPPQEFDFGGDWSQVEKKRPHWFFCASK